MSTKNNPKGRQNEVVVQELKGELLIYDLKINKAFGLNPTSAMIWNLCDGQSSVSEIGRKLSEKLNQPVTDDLVWLAIDQFKTDNLLSESNEIEIKFDGLTRRETIRKVGLASMIALPLIFSLVAPTAAAAQSGGNSGGLTANCQGCTVNSNCASGNCAAFQNVCSAGTDFFSAITPGTFIGEDQLTCTQDGIEFCCSGSATFNFGIFFCICD